MEPPAERDEATSKPSPPVKAKSTPTAGPPLDAAPLLVVNQSSPTSSSSSSAAAAATAAAAVGKAGSTGIVFTL